jgi:hypothetical protein
MVFDGSIFEGQISVLKFIIGKESRSKNGPVLRRMFLGLNVVGKYIKTKVDPRRYDTIIM